LDAQSQRLPAFAARLLAQSDDDRLVSLAFEHPEYTAYKDQWQLLLDAFEGTGGFVNGAYLWPYPAERYEDYLKRQKMARYHNHASAIIGQHVQQVFTQEPDRQTDDPKLAEWWKDVDGHGTSMTAFLRKQLALAHAAGHVGVLMDKTPVLPTGPALRDDQSRPFLASFRAPAILDWRLDGTSVIGVKLSEAVPDNSIADEAPEGDAAFQTLIWDSEGWARFNSDGDVIGGDTPDLGLVPFDTIRPKPSVTTAFIGRPILGNIGLVKAIFNRMSELDEVLRNQGMSTLALEMHEGGDVEQGKKQLGSDIGTATALVANGKMYYVSPDMNIPKNLNDNIQALISELYRIAHIRYERDSLQAESAEAIRLQFKEFNESLQATAFELQRFEYQMVRFYYAWTTPTAQAAEAAFEAANVSINYPEEFFLADLRLDLDAWAAAIAMDLGDTMTKIIKKKAVRRIEPEITPEDLETVDKEIDAQKPEAMLGTQALGMGLANQLKQNAQTRLQAVKKTTSGGSPAGDAGA